MSIYFPVLYNKFIINKILFQDRKECIMKKRLLSLLLLISMLTSTVSCGQADSTEENAASAGETPAAVSEPTTEEPEPEAETELTDGLPEKDMGGYTYNILNYTPEALSWANTRIYAAEMNGEAVNDALFERESEIEERFACSLTTEDNVDPVGTAKAAISAGDAQYQSVFIGENAGIVPLLGFSIAWDNVPYLQLAEEHWNPNATSMFHLNGKQTALAGNISLSVVSRAVCTVFNKRIFEEMFPEDNLYETVRNNEWTLDTFMNYANSAALDLNGDGAWTKDDQYGLNMGRGFKGYIASLLGASGYHFTTADADGNQVFTMHTDENTLNLVTKLMEQLDNAGFYYNEDTTVHGFAPADFFSSGHALFTQGVPHDVEKLRDMEDDIGILPMPKFDAEQEQYYSASWGGELLMLPKTVVLASEGENIGMILEAMSFYAYHNIIPLYKEVALKTKTARDEESSDMLDIVFSSASFDFGTNVLYDAVLAGSVLTSMWEAKSVDSIVSSCTKNEKQISAYIRKNIAEGIEKLPLE